jgi:hypothetical protein
MTGSSDCDHQTVAILNGRLASIPARRIGST